MNVSERCRAAATAPLSEAGWLEAGADPSASVRRVVAARADAPRRVLERLATDPDRQTRQRVAENPGCPTQVLLTCLTDDDWRVRWAAVQHSSADQEVRSAAGRSPDADPRCALAQLPDLEPGLAGVLLADPDWRVREQLAICTNRVEVLEALASDTDRRVRGEVALNAMVTEGLLRRLADDGSAVTRAKVAGCTSLPEDLQLRLASDRSRNVRWWLCAVHDRNRTLMKVMADDSDESIARHARDALGWRQRLLGPVGAALEDRRVQRILRQLEQQHPDRQG